MATDLAWMLFPLHRRQSAHVVLLTASSEAVPPPVLRGPYPNDREFLLAGC